MFGWNSGFGMRSEYPIYKYALSVNPAQLWQEITKQNLPEAKAKLFNYAEQRARYDSDAMYYLGACYHYGYGVEINHIKAIGLYTALASKGRIDAMQQLGYLYETSPDFRDLKAAIEWYTEASTRLFSSTEHEFSTKRLLALEKEGELKQMPAALLAVANAYCFGCATDINKEKAFDVYMQAAGELRDPQAMLALGNFYYHDAPNSPPEAARWYLRAVLASNKDNDEDCAAAFASAKSNLRQCIFLLPPKQRYVITNVLINELLNNPAKDHEALIDELMNNVFDKKLIVKWVKQYAHSLTNDDEKKLWDGLRTNTREDLDQSILHYILWKQRGKKPCDLERGQLKILNTFFSRPVKNTMRADLAAIDISNSML